MLPTITIQIITIPQPTNLGIQNKYVQGETKARAETHTLSFSLSLSQKRPSSINVIAYICCRTLPAKSPGTAAVGGKVLGKRWKSQAIITVKETGRQPYPELVVALKPNLKLSTAKNIYFLLYYAIYLYSWKNKTHTLEVAISLCIES